MKPASTPRLSLDGTTVVRKRASRAKSPLNGRDPLIPSQDPDPSDFEDENEEDNEGELEDEMEEDGDSMGALGLGELTTEDLPRSMQEKLAEKHTLLQPPAAVIPDIFDLIQKDFASKGVPVKYRIYKNNQRLTTINHPWSWDRMQKTYGHGDYRVVATHMGTGQVIKQQTDSIADPNDGRPDVSANAAPAPVQRPELSTLDVLALLQDRERAAKAEAQASSRGSSDSMATMMTAMMQMQSQAAQAAAAAQAQSQQLMMTMMMESNKQMIALMTRDKGTKDALSPIELIAMLEKSKEGGIEMWSKITKQAREDAEEKASYLAEVREAAGPQVQSATDRLIEGLIPVLVGGGVQKLQEVKAEKAAKAAASPSGVVQARAPLSVVPKAAPAQPAPVAPPKQPDPEALLKDLKARIENVIVPQLGPAMVSRQDPKVTATESLGLLHAQGITLTQAQLAGLYPLGAFLELAYANGVPRQGIIAKQAQVWLRSYHAHLTIPSVPTPEASVATTADGSVGSSAQ